MAEEKMISRIQASVLNSLEHILDAESSEIKWIPPVDMNEALRTADIDFSTQIAAGISIGVRPDESHRIAKENYQKLSYLNDFLYDTIIAEFEKAKIGFMIRTDATQVHLLGIFPREQKKEFTERMIRPILKREEELCKVPLCAGIGLTAECPGDLKNAFRTSRYAFDLYFFEEQQIIRFEEIHQEFSYTQDDYYRQLEDAFQGILLKAPDAIDRIDRVIDTIGSMHYGNWRSTQLRTMNFTGELGSKMRQYRLSDSLFFEMQDALQEKVLNAMTLRELKAILHAHYAGLLPNLYSQTRPTASMVIERVKCYMQENFMNTITIQELAKIACVSPNYFSHMFKNETGENYKTYLTNLRLEQARVLLEETDYCLYEVCDKVGYRNVRTFVDAFKQKYSISPGNYRKLMQGGESSDP